MQFLRHTYFCLMLVVVSTLGLRVINANEIDSASQEPWKIINYWSRTCAPCRVEIPELNFLSKELAASNVIVLGVNFDEDPREKTMQIAEFMGIKFPTLTMAKVEALHLSAPSVLPTTYILSPENEVKARLIGAQDRDTIRDKLTELSVLIRYKKLSYQQSEKSSDARMDN